MQRAWFLGVGVSLANSNDRLDRQWAEVLAETPEEADELWFKINQARRESKG